MNNLSKKLITWLDSTMIQHEAKHSNTIMHQIMSPHDKPDIKLKHTTKHATPILYTAFIHTHEQT